MSRSKTGRTAMFAVAAGVWLAAPVAEAADRPAPDDSSRWIVTLGASVEYGPTFPGSKHVGLSAMPSFDIRRFDEPDEKSAPDDNIDYGLFDLGGVEIGPVIGIRDSRSQSDEVNLKGTYAVDWGVDAGLFVQYWAIPDHLRLRTEIRQAVSNGSGLVVDVGADWFQPIAEKWLFSVGPRASLGNDAYMRKYFGVSEIEASRNGGLPAFSAGGSLKSVGLTAAVSYDLTPTLTFQIYDRFDRLTGDAADSPITSKIGSRSQNIVGISLSKAFSISF
ncbi:MipA/OmpV family protein [Rhizobium sp. NPDC090275]|uniref:MipA/OmpV family protein n=1 Tax=Rhizobium sp. NPDC090275 TaxID=3364498 RepID=UPI00383BEA83